MGLFDGVSLVGFFSYDGDEDGLSRYLVDICPQLSEQTDSTLSAGGKFCICITWNTWNFSRL